MPNAGRPFWAWLAVEAPSALDRIRVHVHRFGAVAPARRDGQRDVDAGLLEFVGAGGRLTDAADRCVGDNDLHRLAVRVAKVLLKELLGGKRHVHGLLFQRFAHLQRAAAAVDGRADADNGVIPHKSAFCHVFSSCLKLMHPCTRCARRRMQPGKAGAGPERPVHGIQLHYKMFCGQSPWKKQGSAAVKRTNLFAANLCDSAKK